jgi:N-methylhydantoinase B
MSGGERAGAWAREGESTRGGVPARPRARAPTRPVDPITLEVVRSALYSIADEMRVIVMRSARSPLLKEAGDLSCVLTDAQGRLIAQGEQDIPVHLGCMAHTVKEFLKRVPPEQLRDGDVYFTNAPAVGGNHLPDVKAIRPIFVPTGQLVAFAVALSHWPDVGGALPGSYVPWATDLTQEGLHLTPTRLFDAAGPIRETLDFVLANLRGRVEREGDIFAQRAATEVAARRLREVFDAYGMDTLLACSERLLEESDFLMRAALRAVPDGVYEGEDRLDDDGQVERPIRIAVRIAKQGDRATFDFSGSDPQVRGPLNTTYFIACSATYYVCKTLLGPEIPPNDGCYRALTVVAPEGTVLNPSPTAPVVGGNHETSQRIAEAIIRALARALPDRVTAAGVGSAAIGIIAGRREDGSPFTFYEVHGGGEGAGAERDGAGGLRSNMGNTMNTPVEAIEHEYPLLVERHELLAGSGGAGRRRGGSGVRRAYRLLAPEARLTTMIERCRVAPWGLFGGQPGATAEVALERDGQTRAVRGKDAVELRVGDLVVLDTAGGGGYGPPEEREAELVEADRREGYV